MLARPPHSLVVRQPPVPVHTSLRSATLLVLYGEGDRKSLVPPLCSRRRLLGWHANETKGFRQVPNKTTSTPPFTGRNRPSYADSVEISQRSEMMIIFSPRAGLLAVCTTLVVIVPREKNQNRPMSMNAFTTSAAHGFFAKMTQDRQFLLSEKYRVFSHSVEFQYDLEGNTRTLRFLLN